MSEAKITLGAFGASPQDRSSHCNTYKMSLLPLEFLATPLPSKFEPFPFTKRASAESNFNLLPKYFAWSSANLKT